MMMILIIIVLNATMKIFVPLIITYLILNDHSQIFKLIVRNKSPLDLYTHYADSQFVQKINK